MGEGYAEGVARAELIASDSLVKQPGSIMLLAKRSHSVGTDFSKTAPRISSKGARDLRDPSGSTDPSFLAERRRSGVVPQVPLDREIPRAMGYGLLRETPGGLTVGDLH